MTMDERLLFARFIKDRGTFAPDARVLNLQAPLDSSDTTDCWTHAAAYAERTGADYVEGICLRRKGPGEVVTCAHAWAEEGTPFGRRVVELTPGYEEAYGYRGIVVPRDTESYRRARVGRTRYGVIELDIAFAQQGAGR